MNTSLTNRNSFFHSWDWSAPQRAEIASFLRDKILDSTQWQSLGSVIWKTRHKEVELYQLPSEIDTCRVAIKNYHEHRFMRYFLRPSLAYREALGYETAHALGISCAEVIACGEQRIGPLLKQAYFVTRFEEDTHCLFDLAPGHPMADRHDILLPLLKENIRYIARLHARGYMHGGAHPRNFLWRDNNGHPNIIWIDLATIRKFSLLKKKKQILRDLAKLLKPFHLNANERDELAAEYQAVHRFPIFL